LLLTYTLLTSAGICVYFAERKKEKISSNCAVAKN